MAKGGFPGMMGGGNMQQLARQAQKLQQQMTEAQENLDAAEYEAASGGGMVKVHRLPRVRPEQVIPHEQGVHGVPQKGQREQVDPLGLLGREGL